MKNIEFLKENLIAHRGFYTKIIPENTLVAFAKAIEYNFIIELDIHFLKDDNIVVFHDYDLKRMINKNKIIETLTLDELKRFKINKKYTIPTLQSVLNLVNGAVPILIEIKELNNNSNFFEKLSETLDKYDGQFAIHSSNPNVIDWMYKNKKDYIIGLVLFNDFNYKLLKKYLKKIDFISMNKKSLPLKSKKMILGWTIKSRKELGKYGDLCDNLICNVYALMNKEKGSDL